jgi:hypothetical protein
VPAQLALQEELARQVLLVAVQEIRAQQVPVQQVLLVQQVPRAVEQETRVRLVLAQQVRRAQQGAERETQVLQDLLVVVQETQVPRDLLAVARVRQGLLVIRDPLVVEQALQAPQVQVEMPVIQAQQVRRVQRVMQV